MDRVVGRSGYDNNNDWKRLAIPQQAKRFYVYGLSVDVFVLEQE